MIQLYPCQIVWRNITVSFLILGLLWGAPTDAQSAEILDDFLSPKKHYSYQLRWAYKNTAVNLNQENFFLLAASLSGVEVRLDTSAYEGKRARIYLRLPRQIEGFISTESFLLRWETDRLFYPGSVRPGNRTLLYDGLIESSVIVDVFTFLLEVDARYLDGKIKYAPIYEIETY